MVHTEKTIADLLLRNYSQNNKYLITNVYLFRWESDFFLQKDNGYCYEFEIKISRSDFKKDAKKIDKHKIMKTGLHEFTSFSMDPGSTERIVNVREAKRPNRFYYVAPSGIIKKDEVPDYAGLIVIVDGELVKIKEAPMLHKEVINFDKQLAIKFYHYWLSDRAAVARYKTYLDHYVKLLSDAGVKITTP